MHCHIGDIWDAESSWTTVNDSDSFVRLHFTSFVLFLSFLFFIIYIYILHPELSSNLSLAFPVLFNLFLLLVLWGCPSTSSFSLMSSRLGSLWGCVGLTSLPYPRQPDMPFPTPRTYFSYSPCIYYSLFDHLSPVVSRLCLGQQKGRRRSRMEQVS